MNTAWVVVHSPNLSEIADGNYHTSVMKHR